MTDLIALRCFFLLALVSCQLTTTTGGVVSLGHWPGVQPIRLEIVIDAVAGSRTGAFRVGNWPGSKKTHEAHVAQWTEQLPPKQ
jgi:hypothetical protein